MSKWPKLHSEPFNSAAAGLGSQNVGFLLPYLGVGDQSTLNILIAETKAEILGPSSRYVKSGSAIRLSCRVYLGPDGPDDDYRSNAVMHWFHGQGGGGGRNSVSELHSGLRRSRHYKHRYRRLAVP